jgi:SAM-dependent methyltransferase
VGTNFRDLFSQQASTYAAARPSYPDALYEYIESFVPRRRLAWDYATGNGQAARDLARRFERVIATDASAEQIAHALQVPNVEYRVAPAEASGLASRSIDLVTVAQALHWLDHDRFYAEVRRVTVPGGVIAAWYYGSPHAGDDVEASLREFENETVGPYWNAARKWVDEGYRTIPFPFEEATPPTFELRVRWSLSQLGEYISSWSAVAKFRRERGVDPVAPLMERLGKHWGPSDRTRDVVWPLGIRIGRVG